MTTIALSRLAAAMIGDAPRPVLERGTPVEVEGRYFVDGCDDTFSEVGGCSAPPEPSARTLEDVVLRIRQGGTTRNLASADADDASGDDFGDVTWDVVLPDDLAPGRAVLVTTTSGFPTRLPVRISRDVVSQHRSTW